MFIGVGIGPAPSHLNSSFQQISFYNIIHFFWYILPFYCLKTSQSYFQMVYSLIRLLTYSSIWHICIINCWKENKCTVSTMYTYVRHFRSIILFFLIDNCCKNLLYPLFSLFLHQNKTLLSLVYIRFFLVAYLLYTCFFK